MADERAPAVGKFVQIIFAHYDGPGFPKTADHFGILGWDVVGEEGAGCGGVDAGSIDQILDRHRYTVQRTTPFAAANFYLRAVRLCEEAGLEKDQALVDKILPTVDASVRSAYPAP